MNVSMNIHRWNGLVLGLIVAVMVHLSVATDADRIDEPWPMLLSSEPAGIDAGVALLHQRASGSLEKLVQSARAAEQSQ